MNLGIYILLLGAAAQTYTQSCPSRCLCFGTTVRCMFLQLRNVPRVPPATTILDLRFNKIKKLNPGMFRNMTELNTLLLNNNLITKIEDNTFVGLGKLQNLYLYKNKIHTISRDAFMGLPNLEQLYLHFNYIEELQRGTFRNLPNLERLFLHNNHLTRLPRGLLSHMDKLRRLRLDSNALVCDCQIMWLSEMLKEKQGTEAAATCGTPQEMRGKDIISVTTEELHCEPPEFTQTPQSVEVSFGNSAVFRCQASGEPTPRIKWMHNGNQIPGRAGDGHYTIAEDGSLHISDAQEVHQGVYECVAENEVGAVTAEPVQLVYDGQPSTPRIVREPRDQMVTEGESVTLECRAVGRPWPTITWLKDNRPLAEDIRFTVRPSGTLAIRNVQFQDRGKYRCTATNSQGSVSSTVRMLVQVAPTFTERPSDQPAVEGQEAVFTCKAHGQPRPLIIWYHEGHPMRELRNRRYRVSRDQTELRISDVREADTGEVMCYAENSAGKIRATARLVLRPKTAPRITVLPSDVRVPEGVNAELSCQATGAPKPHIRWIKDGRPLTLGDKHRAVNTGLIITDIQRADRGEYTCVAENDVGRVLASANISVIDERRPFPGDRFLNESFRRAREEVNSALNQSREVLKDKNRRKTPGDLLALFRYPTVDVIPLSRAWEVFERTLELVLENTRESHMVNISDDADYSDLVSPSHLAVLANLSGCAVHRRTVNCDNMCYHHKYRTLDGSCNNLQHPLRGASLVPLKRLLPSVYENGFNTPVGWNTSKLYNGFLKPSARKISTRLMATGSITPDEKYTHMLMQWGQFIDHDLDFTPQAISFSRFSDGRHCNSTCDNQSPCFPIPIPRDDPRIRRHECMGMTRSSGVCNSGMTSVFYKQLQPRQQVNQITSYMDASNVYGSSDDELRHLRNHQDRRGLMRVGLVVPTGKGLLPPNDISAPIDCQIDPHASHVPCFLAGDHRANEQLGLLSMHTIWMREHNRVAKILYNLNPHWDGDMIFHEARKIVIAEMQHITYTHWLPNILGKKGMKLLKKYKGYDPNVDPSIANEFATAAFRFGHTLVNPIIYRLNESFQPIPQGNLALHRAFFAPFRIVEEGGIDPVLRGLIGVSTKKPVPGEFMNLELTEKLFKLAHEIALDLAALNIQRGRDHGLPGYNEYRKLCGLEAGDTFEELAGEITDREVRLKLQELYGHPDNVDLFVGGVAETPLEGAKVGPTFMCIIAGQFQRVRDGDRFWYETPGMFEPCQMTQIRRVTLARVICDNSDHIEHVQPDVFRVAKFPEEYVSCKDIPEVDLKVWTHCCSDCQSSGEFNSITSHFGRRQTNRYSHINNRGDEALPRIQLPGNQPPQRDQIRDRFFNRQSTENDGFVPPRSEEEERLILNRTVQRATVPPSAARQRDLELVEIRMDSMEDIMNNMKNTIKQLKKRLKKLEEEVAEFGEQDLSVEDCIDGNGRVHADGQTWNDNCRSCKCDLGQIECEKEACPAPTCADPKTVPGECCPVC